MCSKKTAAEFSCICWHSVTFKFLVFTGDLLNEVGNVFDRKRLAIVTEFQSRNSLICNQIYFNLKRYVWITHILSILNQFPNPSSFGRRTSTLPLFAHLELN